MEPSPFPFKDYKVFLNAVISETEEHAYKSKLAAAAGCQRSFFSLVISGSVHLTPDHAIGLADFWKLNGIEREFFLELVNYSRAATPRLKKYIESKLANLKKEHENLAKRFQKPNLPSSEVQTSDIYYSQWYFSAIHILLTIPNFKTVAQISARLRLSRQEVMAALEILKTLGLAEEVSRERWQAKLKSIHLPQESAMNAVNHLNWRLRAVQDSSARQSRSLHYTAIHSLSVLDIPKIRERILECIDDVRKTVDPSPEEELVCFSCDFFSV